MYLEGTDFNSNPVYYNVDTKLFVFLASSQFTVTGWVMANERKNTWPYEFGYFHPSDAISRGENLSGMWTLRSGTRIQVDFECSSVAQCG